MRGRLRWRAGNQTKLLVDGSRYFPAMLEAIATAERCLMLEFYYLHSGLLLDRFIEALLEAAGRGVTVRFLCDGFGGMGMISADRRRLIDGGVHLAFYNPVNLRKWNQNFARDHRKLMIVDGHTVFLGGTGLSDEFLVGKGKCAAWHELMVQVRGPVVSDCMGLFAQVWRHTTGERLPAWPIPGAVGDSAMKVASAQGVRQQEIKLSFRRQISLAERRVWLMTAYFLPSWSIRRTLKAAAQRGVDVRLLLPGPITDHPGLYYAARRYYKRLLDAGVRIYEYQPRFLHAKAGICDDWASVGSCNLDHWTLRWNLEANLEVDDPVFTQKLGSCFVEDLAKCEEVTLEKWLSRPWYRRAVEFVRGYLNAIVLRIV